LQLAVRLAIRSAVAHRGAAVALSLPRHAHVARVPVPGGGGAGSCARLLTGEEGHILRQVCRARHACPPPPSPPSPPTPFLATPPTRPFLQTHSSTQLSMHAPNTTAVRAVEHTHHTYPMRCAVRDAEHGRHRSACLYCTTVTAARVGVVSARHAGDARVDGGEEGPQGGAGVSAARAFFAYRCHARSCRCHVVADLC
jgi:hypothetical protein